VISILITNYNKEKFLRRNIELLYKSLFKNFEIIIFDDVSTDNSLRTIKHFKKIKIIKNKKKKFFSPALNQIYGTVECYKKSKGKLICLLDSDDFFKKNKLSEVKKFFDINSKLNCLYNFPVAKKNKFNFKIKDKKNIWPSIFPTSCISLRKKVMRKFIFFAKMYEFPNLEIDARLNIFMKFYYNEYNFIEKKLTIYNDDQFGITSKIPKFSKHWWFRRIEAYNYMQYILKKKNKTFIKTIDYLITKIISKTYKIFE
tara:strand:- start:1250 stop:2020 length:771 start_codon:yes stop_codon:yes gene_type:complete